MILRQEMQTTRRRPVSAPLCQPQIRHCRLGFVVDKVVPGKVFFKYLVFFFIFAICLSLHNVHSFITDAISVIDSIIKFCLKDIYCTESIYSVFKDNLQNCSLNQFE